MYSLPRMPRARCQSLAVDWPSSMETSACGR